MGKTKVSAAYPLLGMLLLIIIVGGVGWLFLSPGSAAKGLVNIVLVSIDTCRPDYLGCYGYQRKTTPNIDAIAQEGILFENVITPIPNTLPAHCSMLTGTVPPYHGVHDNHNYRLPKSNVTLAEAMREHGYTTAGFVSSFVLDSQFGLDQGFDTYDDDVGEGVGTARVLNERRANAVSGVASAWLEEHADERFFLFLHYFDPHSPYDPPEPYALRFSDNRYAGEIAYVDYHLGRVIEKLKNLGLYDSAMIIVTSDHGEGLGEHSETWHGYFIYHSTTKVPLIVKLPASRKAARVQQTVALIDLFPTVLSNVGIQVPSEVQGRDLSAYFAGSSRSGSERYFYSESLVPTKHKCSPLFGLETHQWKYIQASRPELYDLTRDPGETNNVLAMHPERADSFRERLKAVLTETTRVIEEDRGLPLDQESIGRLEALGYVGGAVQEVFEFKSDKEDPKDFIWVFEKITIATQFLHQGNFSALRDACMDILAERWDTARAHEYLGIVAMEEGQLEEASDHYRELLRLEPTSAEAHFALGNVAAREGRLGEAGTYFAEAVRLAEGVDEGSDSLKGTLDRIGRIHPILFEARLHLADTFFARRMVDEAIDAYRKALELDTLVVMSEQFQEIKGSAYLRLGDLLYRKARYDEAIEAYQSGLELRPGFPPGERALERALAARKGATTP
ncbi:MAG: sulfatase-like hydrolase/transferase [Phycisphaerales bacterium]|nr:MAG: sulfatase-like hydrolase/transferase [Phycisphaerales bacterium]